MKTIHFDESGTLGFDFTKNGTSRYFIATFLITTNQNAVKNVVKKVFRAMSKTEYFAKRPLKTTSLAGYSK